MPNRILRDGILSSEKIERLSVHAALLYYKLLSVVDDHGRCEANPKLIRAKCFPLSDSITCEQVNAWMEECGRELIDLYVVEGKNYLEIHNFGQRTRTPSKCPSRTFADKCAQMRANDGLARASTTHTHTPSPSAQGESEGEVGLNGMAKTISSPIGDLAESMYSRHPKAKDFALVPPAILRAIERIEPDELDYIHSLWAKTDDWRKENGRYCPSLAKWLEDRGYEQIPDDYDFQYRQWRKTRKETSNEPPKPDPRPRRQQYSNSA